MINLKCVAVGDGAVGKTCLLISYSTNNFPTEYVPTVFDNYSTIVALEDKTVKLGLWDTAGQAEYDQLRPLSYPETDVFLVCYSVENQDSYDSVSNKWVPEITDLRPGTPFILVALKIDMRDDKESIEKQEKVGKKFITTEQGESLSKKVHAARFMECSAKSQVGVKQVFEAVIRLSSIEGRQQPKGEEKKGCCLLM